MTPPPGARVATFLRSPRGRLGWLLCGATLLLVVGFNACTTYVRPNQVAVKQVILGANKGIQKELHEPGIHFVTPTMERLHRFPSDLQSLVMTDSKVEAKNQTDTRVVPAIKIQTSEGYTVTVDVTVLYRIEDPYQVITQIGPGRLYEDSAIIPRAEQVLRRALGNLDAEDFYRGDLRDKTARQANDLLRQELSSKGIAVTHVLVRQYRYDPRYQQAIEQRKIQDQTVFKNQAEAAAAQVEATKDRIVAEGAALVKTELARGAAEVQKLRSEAELYRRTKEAEGQLMVRLARAEGVDLENRALRGAGSENMVGLKMADVLKGTEVIVVPSDGEGGNPLDLNSALRRFDVRSQ